MGRLYLPPGQKVFACRHCYYLTYRSAQEHDQRVYRLARNPLLIAAVMQSTDLVWGRLGVSALLLGLRRSRKRGW